MTVRETLQDAIPRLESAGIDTARLDAELLLAHTLGVSRTRLFAHPEDPLTSDQQCSLHALLQRRERREPLPYLLGQWEFLDLRLRVSPAVLIPRPETELLVEQVARRLPPGARVLDVGTGSGCIALGLARLRSDVRVVGIDSSPAAVAVARENAASIGLADRVESKVAVFAAELPRALGRFEAIVSNPPYIPEGMLADLAPEVRDYEPREALTGGSDGLALHDPLLRYGGDLLTAEGMLAVEVMAGQWETVRALARRIGGWTEPEVFTDLAGHARVVLWRREPAVL